jgi:hypothetical protein
VTAQRHARVRFKRAIERRALWLAEDAARELPNLPLEDLLMLVRLYAERQSPKYERAALRWLGRYLDEHSPTLQRFAEMTAILAALERQERSVLTGGGEPCTDGNARDRRVFVSPPK